MAAKIATEGCNRVRKAELPPMQNGEYPVIVNGIRHWYKVGGAEHRTTPVVVIHGGPGGNVYNFERTVGPRLEAFATIVYYEQRGCGRSDPPGDPGAYSIPILVADLEALRRAIGVERIIPLGFSFGGELALEYALAHPDRAEKLIAQAPSVGDPSRTVAVQLAGFHSIAQGEIMRQIQMIVDGEGAPDDRLERVWEVVDRETVDRFLFHKAEAARLNRRLWTESGLVNTGDMRRALWLQPRGTPPLLDRLGAIRAPTLIIVGLHDRNIGVDVCKEAAARIPSARLVIFERSAHFPEMEEPERYAAMIREFLALEGR